MSIIRACRFKLLNISLCRLNCNAASSCSSSSSASSNAGEMNFSKVDPSLIPHYESLFRRFMSKSYGSYVQPNGKRVRGVKKMVHLLIFILFFFFLYYYVVFLLAVFSNNELDLSGKNIKCMDN